MAEFKKNNITYLLGAGASANALPTVKMTDISDSIIDSLRKTAHDLKNLSINEKFNSIINVLYDDLIWLADSSEPYKTPDTFAKFLHLKNREELPRLKNALSAFFLIEQVIKRKFDNRALIFLISIMENFHIFPHNIKIISWNYDFQLQLAAETFVQESVIREDGNVTIQAPPLIDYYPCQGFSLRGETGNISIVHLNGIAGFFYGGGFDTFRSFFEHPEQRKADNLLNLYSDKTNNLLSFAWEKNSMTLKSITYAKEIARYTDILVIIGYSFPFFNREVDKEIFNIFKQENRLMKIYYQDPFKSGEFIRNQFELSDKLIIKDIKEVDNYFLPIEL
jgi:hypothetical protein